nr:protein FAR1-related sequence 5 [Tanacetum cinerariifolium]
MHDAHTVVQARCLKLKAELSKLNAKIQHDDHNELVKHFSNLEVNHLNLQLKYQHLKESFGNNTSLPARDAPDFDSVFVIKKMKASIQGKDNEIKKLKMQISQLKETRSEADRTLDFRALDFQITQLTEKVNVLQEHNELFRVKNTKIKQHYKELYDSIKIQRRTYRPLVFGLMPLKTYDWDRSRLKNFVKTFIGIVRFGNDHFGAIIGYEDYVICDSVISRVYYVEGLGHNLFSVGQFCESDLEVAFRKHSCYVLDIDGVELIKGSRSFNLYTISIKDMLKSSPICLLSKASKNKSWLWHRRLNHLNFGTINDLARKDLVRGLPRLKFEKDHLCSACGSHILRVSSASARSSVSQNSVSSDVVVESYVPSGTVLNAFTEEIVAYEKESDETQAVKKLDALGTPESLVTHSNFDTPGGTVYYILKVSADVLLVKGNVYDSVDDCVVAYMKYAAEAGFVVTRSCQKIMLNGDVKQKYLVCNTMGHPKGIHVDTLDLGNNDKQKRNSNLHITGCKARAVFNLDTRTRKLVLNVFDTIHNHELEREEYKHLSKTERQLTYMKQAFTVKAASVNIGATRAHHLLTAIDNHRKYVTVAAGLLKNETTKSYIWLLKAFMKAFGKAHSIVVTDQDGAMRNAIEAEFGGSKHRLCMGHITQKLPAKSPYVYEMPNKKKKKPQYVDTWNDKAEENDKVDLFFKNDRLDRNVVVENYVNEETSIVDHYVHLMSKDKARLGAFVEKLKSLKKEVEADCPNPHSKNKTDNLKQLIGVSKPPAVDVNNPTVGRNSCSLCGDTDHKKRTCPGRFEDQDEVVVQKEVCQEEVVVQKEVCQEEVVQEKVDLAEDEKELFEEDEDLIHE